MRHLLGLLLALVMAAALFFAATWGSMQLAASRGASLTSPHAMGAMGALAATGLLLGVLLCVRAVSPLATGLPGLVLVGWSGLLMASSRLALASIPLQAGIFGRGFHVLLLSGVLALAGMAMIIPLFVPSRWRRYRAEEDEDVLAPGTATGVLS
jgi:hypothetical protein